MWLGLTEQSPLNLGFLFCSKHSVLRKRIVLEGEVLHKLGMLDVLHFLCCLYTSPKIRVLYHLVFYLTTTLPLTPAPWVSRSQRCRSSNVGALLGWPWHAFSSPSFPDAAGSLTLLTLTQKITWRFSDWHLFKAIHFKSKEIKRNGSADIWRCVPDINTKKFTENDTYFQKHFCSSIGILQNVSSSLLLFVNNHYWFAPVLRFKPPWLFVSQLRPWVWNTEAHF